MASRWVSASTKNFKHSTHADMKTIQFDDKEKLSEELSPSVAINKLWIPCIVLYQCIQLVRGDPGITESWWRTPGFWLWSLLMCDCLNVASSLIRCERTSFQHKQRTCQVDWRKVSQNTPGDLSAHWWPSESSRWDLENRTRCVQWWGKLL